MQVTKLRAIREIFKLSSSHWSRSIISSNNEQGSLSSAFTAYKHSRHDGAAHNPSKVPLLLKACASLSSLHDVKALHTKAGPDTHVSSGTDDVSDARRVYDAMPERDDDAFEAVIRAYMRNGDTESASLVFREMPGKTAEAWNVMIAGFIEKGDTASARRLFDQVPHELKGVLTSTLMVGAHAGNGEMEAAREVFELMPERSCHVGSFMVAGYFNKGNVTEAEAIFKRIPVRSLEIWNILIAGYVEYGLAEKALQAFEEMRAEGFEPDELTVGTVLSACGQLGRLDASKKIHRMIEQKKISVNPSVLSELIDMYAKCGDLVNARLVFEGSNERNDSVWNAMIYGFATNGKYKEALEFFGRMEDSNTKPTAFTFLAVLTACAQEGLISEAEAIFDRVSVRSLEIWNTMIIGYVKNGFCEKVLQAFEEMRAEGFEPDECTVAYVLHACARLKLLDAGKKIHQMIEQKRITVNPCVLGGLVDMYVKCGDLANARLVFEGSTERDGFCWNVMILGFSVNRKCKEVLEYFGRMEDSNIRPDALTFQIVLSACAREGLVNEALEVISKMEAYGIKMGIEHYDRMVDLLGRAGRLKEAYDLIKRMPMKPNETVLGTMLGACRIHSDMEMAEQVIKLIGANSFTCPGSQNVLLSDIYAVSEKWEKAERMRLRGMTF